MSHRFSRQNLVSESPINTKGSDQFNSSLGQSYNQNFQIDETIVQNYINTDIKIMSEPNEIAKFFHRLNIIWHDPFPQRPKKEDYKKDLEGQVEKIYEQKSFEKSEDAALFVEKHPVDCIIITSGKDGETLTKRISDKANVLSICIFQDDAVDADSYWNIEIKEHKKIVLTTHDFQEIVLSIKTQIEKWQQTNTSLLRLDFLAFSRLFSDDDKTQNNYLNIYLNGLTNFEDRAQSKADLLNLARLVYQDKNNMDEFEQNYHKYDMKNIFNWYTRESFLYKLTNNCLRIGKPDTIQYCRLVVKDLETAIKEQYQDFQKNKKAFNGLLYRSAYLTNEEWTKLEQNRGKEIEMRGFLSTTKIRDMAIAYMDEDRTRKILITIIVPPIPGEDGQGFGDTTEFSSFKSEEEVLFNVKSRFTILDTLTETIKGVKYKHLVLLYGNHEISKFIRLTSPAIEVNIDTKSVIKCFNCDSEVNTRQKPFLFFVNLANHHEKLCYNCLGRTKALETSVFVCMPSLVPNIRIEGFLTEYKKSLNIPFYGQKCKSCSNPEISRQFSCQICKEQKKTWCNRCFNIENECVAKGHFLLLENHPYTFWSRKMPESELIQIEHRSKRLSHGEVYFQTHDFKKAEEYYQKCLEVIKKDNQDDQALANIHGELGLVYSKLGQLEKAKENHLNSLEINKKNFESRRAETAGSYSNIGNVYLQLGELKKAMECHTEAEKIYKGIHQDKHEELANCYSNLGNTHHQLGQFEKAIEYHLKAQEIYTSLSGTQHYSTANSYNNIGIAYQSLGEFNEALECYSKALKIRKNVYGGKHPVTASSYSNLGALYLQLGQSEKAEEYHLIALEIYIAAYGNNHYETANSYNSLGNTYHQLKNYDKALEYYSRSLEIREAVYGDEHPNVADCYNNIGSIHYEKGDLEEAKKYYKYSLEIYKSFYEENHVALSDVYTNLGNVYNQLDELNKAISYYLQALEIRMAVYGDLHPQTANSYNNLGLIYSQQEHFYKAKARHQKAMKIYTSIFGITHFQVAICYYHLGDVYSDLKFSKKAIRCYNQALKIQEEVYKEGHPDTANTYTSLGLLYYKLDDLEEAKDYILKAYKIRNSLYGPSHSEVMESYDHLKVVCLQLGESLQTVLDLIRNCSSEDNSSGRETLQNGSYENNQIINKSTRDNSKEIENLKKEDQPQADAGALPVEEQIAPHEGAEGQKGREELYYSWQAQNNPDDNETYFSWGEWLFDQKRYREAYRKFEISNQVKPLTRDQSKKLMAAKEKEPLGQLSR